MFTCADVSLVVSPLPELACKGLLPCVDFEFRKE